MFEMMAGRVDETEDGHFVGTVFVSFMGPLFPLRSMYVVKETYSRQGNTSTMSWQGVDLPIQPASVLLGYVRVWLPIFAFAIPIALMWGESVDFMRREWLITVWLIAIWIVSLFVRGRARGERGAQLRALGAATGLQLDPRALERISRVGRADVLAHELGQHGIATDTPDALEGSLGRSAESALPVAYAYARYKAVDDRAWSKVADAIWSRLSRQA